MNDILSFIHFYTFLYIFSIFMFFLTKFEIFLRKIKYYYHQLTAIKMARASTPIMSNGETPIANSFEVPAKSVVKHFKRRNFKRMMLYVAAVPLGVLVGIVVVIPMYIITCGGVCETEER